MKIGPDTLPDIAHFDRFESLFLEYAKESYPTTFLRPKISKVRLYDAHYAWQDDLSRVEGREQNLDKGLDHFKQCGHLAYWMRRMAPIVEYDDHIVKYESGEEIYKDEMRARKLLFEYGTEFIAFDFAFQICFYYESERTDRHTEFKAPLLTPNYLRDICHMLKFKHVSPHSMTLIYRSLFL